MTRSGYAMVTYFAAMSVAVASFIPTPTRFIWNATASAPVGLYTISPVDRLEVSDLVALQPPEPLTDFMAKRGYVRRGTPLLKHVLALPGQQVCRIGRVITVDGIEMGDALERDRLGRPLLVWRGCRTIAAGELFLMNAEVRDSLDSRYFGPLPVSAVIGRATPLYTDEDGDGRFIWRAPTR
ncbi:S26 family signal peptidase [Phyllobacterium leguminum]|uniref:S26 family signal peptidase n=1 Tax=Phyllobacterium leguminum TaxID=314237 RepID=UPI000DA146B9|nr:S26 family signal peptidase [Phyllobacterium leguminum]